MLDKKRKIDLKKKKAYSVTVKSDMTTTVISAHAI